MLISKNDLTPTEIIDLFKSSTKDDWIKGEGFENDEPEFGSKKNLLISLWYSPNIHLQGFELRYGYQTVAIVGEPGSGKVINIIDDTIVLV